MTESVKPKTPTGVKLLAAGILIFGLICFGSAGLNILYINELAVGILFLGLGAFSIFLAKATWSLKRWAWYTNAGLCLIGVPLWYIYSMWDLLWYAFSVGVDELIIASLCVGSIIPLIVGLAWLGCLFRVKHVFLKTQKGREEMKTKIEIFTVLSNGRVKGFTISYKELSDDAIQYLINEFKKANEHSQATLRGENYKFGWFHRRHLKKTIKEYEEKIEILSEELERRKEVKT